MINLFSDDVPVDYVPVDDVPVDDAQVSDDQVDYAHKVFFRSDY